MDHGIHISLDVSHYIMDNMGIFHFIHEKKYSDLPLLPLLSIAQANAREATR
jgi:hypothetical protein